MKKTIPALLLACVLFACKKEKNAESNEPASDTKVPVKFSVQNLLLSQEDMSENGRVQTDTSLKRFSNIYYMAYKVNSNYENTNVSYISQDTVNNKSNFGVISDSLAPGTYTISLAATTEKLTVFGQGQWIYAQSYLGAKTGDEYRMGEFFHKMTTVTISAGDNPSAIEVPLERKVGLVKLDFKDALPASDPNGQVDFYVTNVCRSFTISNEQGTQPHISYRLTLRRTSQTTWEDFLVSQSGYTVNINLNWKDKVTGAPMSKTFTNVTIAPNKKTIISGYLYGAPLNPGGGDYSLKLNQTWSSDSTVLSIN
ncbi:FimB/Mfa2 family fimbrial subunit [Longitalea arenae]|uniref:FimB/Mfa2 family fimbrial subunit n=1 Tax=Longitalea arenae TaxID=2812558 RepID=UPI0019685AC6|nr:FimB/Mfa2 family fimbrial subunit [Longitalea arenae]